ncbi:MAG: hypothetical protein JWN04_399 [Myxococcaceae bacterium]|nr:hypothetical protein [Myxococcaceae bacterium]
MREPEHVYIGIRCGDVWQVCLADAITEGELRGVDVLRDLRCTLVFGTCPQAALIQIRGQAQRERDPFLALRMEGHASPGLALVRAYVDRARAAELLRQPSIMVGQSAGLTDGMVGR